MIKKRFSIWPEKKIKKDIPNFLFFIYCSIFFIFFWIISLYINITNILFWESKLDIFTKDLQTLSIIFLPIDRDISKELFTLDKIVQSYLNWENVLKTKKSEIEEVRWYIIEHKDYLSSVWFERYNTLMNFLNDIYDQRDEIYNLLWENQAFNYLIPLQNWNEKRPNGWFFGSFAFLTLNWWHIENLEIIDSYLADYIAPNTRIWLPNRYSKIFWEKQLWFVAWNKFWFTDIDWKNLKTLYEKSFNEEYDINRVNEIYSENQRKMLQNKYIKWVIFLDSNLLTELLPWFKEKMREWQFINASIDIIRGEVRSNKKEIYISEVLNYFFKNTTTILKNLINNWDDVLNKRYIQIYLSDYNVSENFKNMLRKYNLNTKYDSNTIYAWDINTANNKSDWFISKKIRLFNEDGDLLYSPVSEIISLDNLPAWNYQLIIDYNFFIPESYRNFITSLEKKYNISITSREKGILVTWPINHFWNTSNRFWENKWIIYYPRNITITSIEWDISDILKFQTDFSQWLNYIVYIDKNQDQKQIVINFTIH